jgi:predicted ATPase
MMTRRIAVTGGPGAGKTTLWRQLTSTRADRLVGVPEVATSLLLHVFPPIRNEAQRCAVQRSIYEVQKSSELFHAEHLSERQVLLCDRGTPDGGGYWPTGHEDFFSTMSTSWDAELARYEAVIFLETAAAGGYSIAEGNDARVEDIETAVAIDRRLHAVWSRHPRFHHIGHEREFSTKIANATAVLHALLDATMLRAP